MTTAHDRPEDPWPDLEIDGDQAVLADLIAAFAASRSQSRLLPTTDQLARRFHTKTDQVNAAIQHLVDTGRLEMITSGRVRRPTPHADLAAEEPRAGVDWQINGGELACASAHTCSERVTGWIARALHVPCDAPLTIVHRIITLNGEPAAQTSTVLHPLVAEALPRRRWGPQSAGAILAGFGLATHTARMAAQIRPSTSEAAHTLGIETGHPAIDLRQVLELTAGPQPAAVIAAWLHPSLFRVTVRQHGESDVLAV